jgi:uncharacterized membrane-anchored protein
MVDLRAEWSKVPAEKQKAVLLAVSLTVIGLGMLVAGMVLYVTEGMAGMLGLFFCGLLALVPGLYHLRIVWLLLRNQSEGWVSWHDVPTVS